MKVALVYDRVNKWGGAERVLLALHEIWPEAPLYTAVYDEKRAAWAKVFKIKTSFLQHIPFAKSYHELYPWFTPMAFESFTFDEYDAVISVTSAEAKGIVTKPKTLHICYCLTPTRYLWSGYEQYQAHPGMGALSGLARVSHALLAPTLRRWDLVAASRPDYYIAISNRVKERIERYYHRASDVIYPPADLEKFKSKHKTLNSKHSYFLVVSRLVGHKRVDVIIEAFNELGWPLVIIGDGLQKEELKHIARNNIQFIDRYLTEAELSSYYESCRALIHAADEDFGIVAVEALAAGKPVVTFAESGVAEIVEHGKTGVLFDEQSKRAIISALRIFDSTRIDPEVCRARALQFTKERFFKEFKDRVSTLYQQYKKL